MMVSAFATAAGFQRLYHGEVAALVVAAWCMLIAGGCATGVATSSLPPPTAEEQPMERLLRTEIQPWLGTPHRLGGMSRRGIDCSGLVVVLYDEIFSLALPRTTGGMMRTGKRVEKVDLVAGDLVFFKPGQKLNHVGIYLGRGEFAHASTRRGVMISRLADDFWQSCYLTARRVLS